MLRFSQKLMIVPLSKLDQFRKRNQKRNAALYNPGLVEGLDFLVCPVSNARLSMIKSNYITNVLGMSVEEYDRLYPGVRGVSANRKSNIKTGLHKVDPLTGLSKYELGQKLAQEKLKEVDPTTGLSGYEKKGRKTRATHMANIDQFGRNGYQQQADARLTTVLDNGLTIEQNAHIKQRNTLIKNIENNKRIGRKASKLSVKWLTPIVEYLTKNNINFYFDRMEFGIKDPNSPNYFFFDLTITNYNIAIEFQSIAWHANPAWNDNTWNSWAPPRGTKKTASEALAYDYYKAKTLYQTRGITTYYVWEDTATQDAEDILCLLKTLNTKF